MRRAAAGGRRARLCAAALLAALVGAGLGACGGGSVIVSTGTTSARPSSASSTIPTTTTTLTQDGAATTVIASGTTTTTILPGDNRPTIEIGDMNTSEQFILGALYFEALRAQGYSVDLTRNIGAPQVALAAVQQGAIDIFPEYLNVWVRQMAGDTRPLHSLAQAYAVGEKFAHTHGLTLLAPTPFSSTSGIAVLTSYAQEHDLRTLGDLSAVAPTLTLGSPLVFTNDPEGLPAIESAYGFTPATVTPVTIGEQYSDLREGLVQAVYVGTTDGQLSQPLYTLLRDPARVLGFGNVVPVVSRATIAAEGEDFVRTIERVDRLLTTSVMRGLNAEVVIGRHDSDVVAREFLQGNGVVPLPPVTTTTTTATTTSTRSSG